MWIRICLSLFLLDTPAPATPCELHYRNLSGSPAFNVSATVADIESILKKILADGKIEEQEARPLLRMALENAIQHGVEDMYMPSAAPLKLKVKQGPEETEIQITNFTFKKFPERLQRNFAPGESLALANEERPFPRGFGLGLGQMFRAFASMPAGSEMGWSVLENTATFRLKIKHSPR